LEFRLEGDGALESSQEWAKTMVYRPFGSKYDGDFGNPVSNLLAEKEKIIVRLLFC
jgi:hypothetical protein